MEKEEKFRVIAGLLAFFLGQFGLHNFYLGKYKKGVLQLVLTLIFRGFHMRFIVLIMVFWTIAEAILIVNGKITDSNGEELI